MTVGASTWGSPLTLLSGNSGSITVSGAQNITGTLSVTGPTTLDANITSSGSQTYNSAVTIGANDTLTTTNSAVDFVSTVNDATSNTHSLTIAAGSGTVTFGSAVGATELASLAVTGPTTLDGNVTTGGGPDLQQRSHRRW